MTSTRGKGIFAALAICGALLVPTAATADSSTYSTRSSALERAPFNVSFTELTRNGKVVAVKAFKFSGVNATCKVGGNIDVRGHAPRMNVHSRKFSSTFHDNGGRVRINGKFKNHGAKATGRIRVNGKFGQARGCVGNRSFRATQN